MRVNRNRLDLRSLTVNQPCTITTGTTSVKLVHTGHTLQMGMYLKGVAPLRISDRMGSVEDEHGKGRLTEWFHVDALAPCRLYVLTVTGVDENGRPVGWQIRDRTPGDMEGPKRTDMRSVIGKLFGR